MSLAQDDNFSRGTLDVVRIPRCSATIWNRPRYRHAASDLTFPRDARLVYSNELKPG